MSGFDVDPTELFAAGARVSEAALDGHAAVTRARLGADELFTGGWSGAAAAAFQRGVDDWLAGAVQMLSGLDELSSALTAAGHDYANAEQRSGNSVDAVGRLAS